MNSDIYNAIKRSGVLDEINLLSNDYSRVKDFIDQLTTPEKTYTEPKQKPNFPLFKGIDNLAFRDVEDIPAAKVLEQNAKTILQEIKLIDLSKYHFYSPNNKAGANTKTWGILPFYYMGAELPQFTKLCPNTSSIIKSLPNLCANYAWGDALLSWQAPNSILSPHCSVDNLRIRIHLAIDIPEKTGIRVGDIKTTWENGRCLVFDDSFEHEVWNNSEQGRTVLIVDTWHPNINTKERALLTYIFNKWEVKKVFYRFRLEHTCMQANKIDSIAENLKRLERKAFSFNSQ